MKEYIFKYPDFHGGFNYKSVSNHSVVTHDNDGKMIGSRPVNPLYKGQRLRSGVVEEYSDNVVITKDNFGNVTILNRKKVESAIFRKAFRQGNDLNISKALTSSLKKSSTAATAPGFKGFKNPFKNLMRNKGSNPAGDGEKKDSETPKVPGMQWNAKGGQKPDHKYIERRINPNNPDEYIYIYELPGGKRIAKNEDGKELKEYNPGQHKFQDYKHNHEKTENRLGLNYNGFPVSYKHPADDNLYLHLTTNLSSGGFLAPHMKASGKWQAVSWETGEVVDDDYQFPEGFDFSKLEYSDVYKSEEPVRAVRLKQLTNETSNVSDEEVRAGTEQFKSELTQAQNYSSGQTAKDYFSQFRKNDSISFLGKTGVVEDVSDNLIVLRSSHGIGIFNKQVFYERLERDRNLKAGDVITEEGEDLTVNEISDNFFSVINKKGEKKLLKRTTDLKLLNRPESPAQTELDEEFPEDLFSRKENIPELDHPEDYQMMNEHPDYIQTDGYKHFLNLIDDMTGKIESFSGDDAEVIRVNDLRYKFKPNYKFSGLRIDYELLYNPADNTVKQLLNGEEKFIRDTNGREYQIAAYYDIAPFDGVLFDREAGEFKRVKEQRWLNPEKPKGENFEKLYMTDEEFDQYTGDILKNVEEKRKTEKENSTVPTRKRSSKTSQTSAVSQEKIREIEESRKAREERIKQVLSSDQYREKLESIRGKGFDVEDGKLTGSKKVKVNGLEFEFRTEYNFDKDTFDIKGYNLPVSEFEYRGKTYRINDIREDAEDGITVFRELEPGEPVRGFDGIGQSFTWYSLQSENGPYGWKPVNNRGIQGRSDMIIMPNGEKRQGQWMVVELDDIHASHDHNTFKPNPQFPVDPETGITANDRDYEKDPVAQALVGDYAQNFDTRGINNSKAANQNIIISKDNIVLSGNNRTMSAKLASEKYPDRMDEYKQELLSQSQFYGIDPETIKQMKNPFLVKVDMDFNGNYGKAELRKYNQSEMKEKDFKQKAAEYSDLFLKNESGRQELSQLLSSYNNLSELYQHQPGLSKLQQILIGSNVISNHEVNSIINEREDQIKGKQAYLTDNGKTLLRTIGLGLMLDTDALQVSDAPNVSDYTNKLYSAVNQGIANVGLSQGYSLRDHISDSVNLEYNYQSYRKTTEKAGKTPSVDDFFSMRDMFNPAGYDKRVVAFKLLGDQGPRAIQSALKRYNNAAKEEIEGEGGLFGDKRSDRELFEEYVINATHEDESGNLVPLFSEKEKAILSAYDYQVERSKIKLDRPEAEQDEKAVETAENEPDNQESLLF